MCMGVREHGCVNACTSVRARDRVCDQVSPSACERVSVRVFMSCEHACLSVRDSV